MTQKANLAWRLKLAKQKAEALLRDLGRETLPVDVVAIANDHGIDVAAKSDTGSGVSGMLLRHGNSFGILYATHVSSLGFQRFSIAHELGHYFLEGHIDQVLRTGVHESCAGFVSVDPYEQEADQFAAGLLMPSRLFEIELRRHDDGLAAIEHLAAACVTSLTATAIRTAELSRSAMAVIVSSGPRVEYCRISESMKMLKGLKPPRRGDLIPGGTATVRFAENPALVAAAERGQCNLDARIWVDGNRRVEAVEEVIGLGSYGRTLTVVTCPALESESYGYDESDGEEELIESWTPKFGKRR